MIAQNNVSDDAKGQYLDDAIFFSFFFLPEEMRERSKSRVEDGRDLEISFCFCSRTKVALLDEMNIGWKATSTAWICVASNNKVD